MRKHKRGFTITEVSLFLAITGLLFMGITAGTQNAIFQQRYNDAVQSFAEFLRSAYSQVANVENVYGGGMSDKAIYGKLITFGEEQNLEGNSNSDGSVFSYTVIGKIEEKGGTGRALSELASLDPTVIDDNGTYAGIAEEFIPKWGSSIQTTSSWNTTGPGRDGYEAYKGTILIVRHPKSGTIFTYSMENEVIEVNKIHNDSVGSTLPDDFLKKYLNVDNIEHFTLVDDYNLDFCINPNGNVRGSRRDVRIAAGARNASSVEIIDADSDENQCNG